MISKEAIRDWFSELQTDICSRLEKADGKVSFATDAWQRPGGGGGLTRVAIDGNIIEKGGVNFSSVWGKTPAPVLQSLKLDPTENSDFFATGVSIVIHPFSPRLPIIHMNVRYFEMSNGTWWFGGGIDLSPHYVVAKDATYFHQALKRVCDKHNTGFYPTFKQWADDYFYIKHRNETRGVGGIFFDYLKEEDGFSKESRFAFVKDVGLEFSPIYVELLSRNASMPYTEREKSWQAIRRGRYVEFNLVWDRGTKFGLDTDGRTESILMSLPPQAEWAYRHEPELASEEAETVAYLRKGIDWVNAAEGRKGDDTDDSNR
ncbi:MAG: oxygen-dependent coproporphyrinogen oxidase [Chryseolinea sp.]